MKKYFAGFLRLLMFAAVLMLLDCQPKQTAEVNSNAPNAVKTNQTPAKEESFDACALIADEEMISVQKDQIKKKTNSSKVSGALLVSQCFYEMNDYPKSISFQITQPSANAAVKADIREIWEKQYKREPEADNDREEEQERDKDKKDSGKKETESSRLNVPNLGDEALHVGNRLSESLYVLKGNNILRIGIGGTDNEKVRFEKLKKLAEYALKRL